MDYERSEPETRDNSTGPLCVAVGEASVQPPLEGVFNLPRRNPNDPAKL